MAAKTGQARDLGAEVAFLTRALKAPSLREAAGRLAERARAENWSHEEFLVACLQREVAARESHGGEGRIRQARFPARKTLEEFDFTFQRSVKKTIVEHLGQLDFLHARENVILLGPRLPPNGSLDSARPSVKARSRPSSSACRSSRSSWSTRSAISRSIP
ncbi:MAG TPA: ATP-binding protein, partial [Novosphingobium sp.]